MIFHVLWRMLDEVKRKVLTLGKLEIDISCILKMIEWESKGYLWMLEMFGK